MPKRMSLEKFVAKGRAAQDAVDAIVGEIRGGVPMEKATLVQEIPVKDVHKSPFQPRHDRENAFAGPKFDELVESVKARGVIEPIIVRHRTVENMPAFELVIGERRLRAAQVAGLDTIPALLRPMEDAEVILLQVVENYHREDLDPIEKAEALQRALSLQDETLGSGKPLYTQASLAKELGITQPTVANMLRLLKLPEPVKEQISASTHGAGEGERALSPAHAQVLIPFGQYPWIMEAIEQRTKAEGLPPAKQFPEMVEEVLFGQWKSATMLVRPLSEGEFFAGGRHIEFQTRTKGLPRDWSQLEGYDQTEPEKPGPGPCTDCPHIRTLKRDRYGGKEEAKFCMLSVCWEGKQKAHRATERKGEAPSPAVAEKVQELKDDPRRINVAGLKASEYTFLTCGKDNTMGSYQWDRVKPIFDVEAICRTNCPFKTEDGNRCYRQGFKVQAGKILALGAVCLKPSHFKQLQEQQGATLLKTWKDGTVARLKGLAKKAAKGLDAEDLVDLLLRSLGNDIENRKLVELLGWQKGKLAMTELFQLVFGIQDRGMQKKSLATRTRKELETYLKFALEWRRADKMR
jgi:ParB/RepB/Spo0J family partition protein